MRRSLAALPLLLLLGALWPPRASAGLPASELIKKAGFEQRLGVPLPLDAPFRDASGKTVTLGGLLHGRPVLLVPIYLTCPMLCPMVLDNLIRGLRMLSMRVGRDFDVVVYSFDPKDTPARAAKRRQDLIAQYRRPGTDGGFHLLTGDESSIKRLDAAVGLRAVSDTGQFAHSPGIVVITPQGRSSRYLFGIDYSARDLRLALVDASSGKLGELTDQVLLLCFHYDETSGRYTVSILRVLRLMALATVAAIVGGVALMSRGRRA